MKAVDGINGKGSMSLPKKSNICRGKLIISSGCHGVVILKEPGSICCEDIQTAIALFSQYDHCDFLPTENKWTYRMSQMYCKEIGTCKCKIVYNLK